MIIREYEPADWPGVWSLLEPVFRAGETYAVPRAISSEEARLLWTTAPKRVFVVVDDAEDRLLGTYYLRPNAEGPGAHVGNCGYVVAAWARGKGIASLMCQHSQEEARFRGFHAMQFNLVVSTNVTAVRLWESLGFKIVGTIPSAFDHPSLGFVDAHVMYKLLDRGAPARGASSVDSTARLDKPLKLSVALAPLGLALGAQWQHAEQT